MRVFAGSQIGGCDESSDRQRRFSRMIYLPYRLGEPVVRVITLVHLGVNQLYRSTK